MAGEAALTAEEQEFYADYAYDDPIVSVFCQVGTVVETITDNDDDVVVETIADNDDDAVEEADDTSDDVATEEADDTTNDVATNNPDRSGTSTAMSAHLGIPASKIAALEKVVDDTYAGGHDDI